MRLAYKWKVLICVVFGLFMVILDTTVVNVAFQTLRREYDATLAEAQWIISIYVLALGISTPVAGFLADRFGTKLIYIAGLGIFATGSLICGISPSLWTLIPARALQGVGGGLALPLGSAQLLRIFPVNEQGKALGMFGIVLVVAPGLGPILGGWLVDMEHWRWIFFINLPIGALGIFLARRFLREQKSERRPRLDVPGLVAEVVGFGAVLYAAAQVENFGWGAPRVLIAFAVGAVGLTAFVLIELFVAEQPLLDLRLYAERTFLVASLIGYVTVLALFGAEFMMPVYLQSLRGYTALGTGLVLLPLAITSGIAMPAAGRLYDRIGPRPIILLGFVVLSLNTWQLSRLTATTPIGWIIFLMVLRGLALGMTVQTTFVTALSVVSGPMLPRGSSLVNGARQVMQSLSVALLATVLASTLSPETRAFQRRAQEAPVAPGHSFVLCPQGARGNAEAAPSVAAASATPAAAPAAEVLARACSESIAGFERAYRLTFYAALLALALGLWMPGWPGAWHGRQVAAAPAG